MRKYAQAYSRKLEQSDTLEPEREERVKTTWCLFLLLTHRFSPSHYCGKRYQCVNI